MNVEIRKIAKREKKKVEKLLQLYLHDLSEYFPIPFDSKKCEYKYDLSKYFETDYAYFIKQDNKIVGFILIDDNKNDNYEISEIFILNNYKRHKIGEQAVIKVFNKYKGNWVIKAVPLSPIAESFWKKTINNYTNGNYKLEYTGKYNRAEFNFYNK